MTPRKPSPSKPVAAYLRLSRAADDSTSIAAQRALVREEATRRNWPEPIEFADEGISGSKDIKRPARDAMERRVGAGEFGALICKSVDRLARSSADFARLAKVCRDTGTALVVTDLSVDSSTPAGGMVLGVLAQMAEFEAALISARVRQGNDEKVRQGRALAGPVPFHLRNVKRAEGGTFRALDETKAPIAAEAVRRLLAGESYRAIALDFTRRGIPAPRNRGGAWSSGTIRQVVSNPAIAGMTRRLGDFARGEDGLPRVDAATAIIDMPTWDRLSDLLAARGQTFKPRTVERERLLLDGLAVCAGCGGRLRRSSTTRQDKKYFAYNCSRGTRGSCLHRAAISVNVLDGIVERQYLERFGIFRAVEVTVEEHPDVVRDRSLTVAEIKATRERLLTADLDDIAALTDRLRDLSVRLDSLRAAEAMRVERDLGMTFGEAWEGADHEARRALIADAIECVRVSKGRGDGRVQISWRS